MGMCEMERQRSMVHVNEATPHFTYTLTIQCGELDYKFNHACTEAQHKITESQWEFHMSWIIISEKITGHE